MSTGGVYQLLANDGKQDVMLTATKLLNDRLKEIHRIRCKNPNIKNPMPTLVDIEKTHVFFMNAHFKPFVQMGYEYQSIQPQEGSLRFGNTISFSLPQFGDFFHDMVLHVRLEGLAASVAGDQVRYCDLPGHRLLKRVAFQVNRNTLDEYDSDTLNFHYNFFVPEFKRASYLRGVGQEIPKLATLTQDGGVDEIRERKFILDGPQTPKAAQPPLDMWIPLIFWFNKDPRLSLPSIAVPYGQRFITVEFATVAEIAFGVDNGGGGAFTSPTGTAVELFTNNIFVNPEIHDIFIKRVGFTMIRVHRQERQPIDSPVDQVLLDQLKWPAETFYIGIKPTINIGTADHWWKFHFVTTRRRAYPVAVPNPAPPPIEQLGFDDAIWFDETPMVDTISLITHAIELYRVTPARFFNIYIPYQYGGANVGSPVDIGVYMATFNLYPGSYQPSGYVNLSRTREFYFKYTSSILSTFISGVLTITIIAINFLLIAEGQAVLRYNV